MSCSAPFQCIKNEMKKNTGFFSFSANILQNKFIYLRFQLHIT
jgi:hypothetical protein